MVELRNAGMFELRQNPLLGGKVTARAQRWIERRRRAKRDPTRSMRAPFFGAQRPLLRDRADALQRGVRGRGGGA